ncbi:MAG: hypothetical protein JWM20_184 [Patescibacteria group bacterium]|nr:hypothetical protein [Patescibacteria group bacterium]
MSYQHFLITRFNIRATYAKLRDPNNNPMNLILDSAYLENRFRLFETYTFPSIKNQTSQNFKWIILFHKETPAAFKEKIQGLKKQYDFIDLYFGDDEPFRFEKFIDDSGYKNEWFITSRIDNDDMFDNQYMEAVQTYAEDNLRRCIVSLEKGQQLDLRTDITHEFNAKNNHFLSMIAPKDGCILQYNHSKIFESGEEVVLLPSSKPMWIEIVHESNVSNEVRK